MIWGYHYFRKHPVKSSLTCFFWGSKVKLECLLPKIDLESNERALFKRRRKVAFVPPSRTVVAGICGSLISMASRATEYVIEIMFK